MIAQTDNTSQTDVNTLHSVLTASTIASRGTVEITHMVRKVTAITTAEHKVIVVLIRNRMKVDAVKFVREQYCVSLVEAKSIVDSIGEQIIGMF